MTKANKIRFLLIGTALLLALLFLLYQTWYLDRSFQRIEKDNSGIPVKIKLLETRPEPFLEILTKLTLTNNFDAPRWYLFPIILGDTLPDTGYFESIKNTMQGIQSKKYPIEKSNLRIITTQFFGADGLNDAFLAFYLPPQSTVSLENYMFPMWKKDRHEPFEVWEVENLMVDGKFFFEKVLTYDALCSANVHLATKVINRHFLLPGQCLECNQESMENPSGSLLKSPVSYIQAVGIRKLSIKLDGNG